MHNPTSERRQFTRINFDKHTIIKHGDQSWDVELVDLSLNGLLIKQPKGWQIHTHDELTAAITLDDEVTITMSIKERHREDGMIGFQCMHIDIDSISHLRRLVELNLGDVALLERELHALGH